MSLAQLFYDKQALRECFRRRRHRRRSASRRQRCRLESLEPRLLLSGDPLLDPPIVISTSIAEGQVAEAGDVSIEVRFNEPLQTEGASTTSLGPEDVILTSTHSALSIIPESLTYEQGTDTVIIAYDNLPDGDYTLTLLSSTSAFRDEQGDPLDGDGDGVGGDPFVRSFRLDTTSRDYPADFVANPAGSLVFSAPFPGEFHVAGDEDAFTLPLDAGQAPAFFVDPLDPSIVGRIELLDPGGTPIAIAAASAPDEFVRLEHGVVTASGVYTVRLSSLAGTGAYQAFGNLNVGQEPERFGGPGNDTLATAVSLDVLPGASIGLPGGGDRMAVTGRTEAGASDFFGFELAAGQSATVWLSTSPDRNLSLELRDGAGALLGTGSAEAADQLASLYVRDFVAPAAGTYFAEVGGDLDSSYRLVVTRGAALEREPNGAGGQPQDLTLTGRALGSLGDTLQRGRTIKVAVVSTGSNDTGISQTVNQLNDQTFFDFDATLVQPFQADSVAELDAYDVVVIGGSGATSGGDAFDQIAPALRTWVESGGGLVAVGWTVLGAGSGFGTPVPDLDAVVPVNTAGEHGGFASTSSFQLPFDLVNDTHPVTRGLTDITMPVGSALETPLDSPLVDAGATMLARFSLWPAAARRRRRAWGARSISASPSRAARRATPWVSAAGPPTSSWNGPWPGPAWRTGRTSI